MVKTNCVCGYTWKYKGAANPKTGIISCPRCRTTLSLKQAIKRGKGQPLISKVDGKIKNANKNIPIKKGGDKRWEK